jgi:multisubunit Na+/H+ antiporter MnhG subunit
MLDLRWPIGLMFSIVGALLAVTGALSRPEDYRRALDININLWWGVVLLVFGAAMLLFAWKGQQTGSTPATKDAA